MYHNSLNKNLTLYTSLTTLNRLLIIISLNKGWLLYPLYYNNNHQLESILFGYSRLYKFFFKLKGFGYKWKYLLHLKKHKQNIFFKLGYTHRINLLVQNNLKIKIRKRRLILKHRSYSFIRNNFNLLFFLYKSYLYNKKGIYLRGTRFQLKISKKKSKF